MRRVRRAWVLVSLLALASAGCGHPSRVRPVSLVRPTTTTASTTTSTTTTSTTTTTAPTTTAPPRTTVPPTTVKAAAAPRPARTAPGPITPYVGLGTWVDVYDWSHYHNTTPTVGPDQVDQMAQEGVQTLFIQTAKSDTPDVISEKDLLLPILERAHQRGIRVVAWYLPALDDVPNDLNRLIASAHLPVDGLAVDIESKKVSDINQRNANLVSLSAQLRQALPGRAIGAIVLPPVVTEVVNPNYWPSFPWHDIAPDYDVWQIMGYWTNRTTASGYRDAYRYTDENMRRLRADLANPKAAVHPVGGIGDQTTAADIDGFLRAAVHDGAIGGSIYDWRTTDPSLWPALRKFRG